MANHHQRRRTVLNVEALETRETPSAAAPTWVTVSQSFDTTPAGTLPTNWSHWSTEKGFTVSAQNSLSGVHDLAMVDSNSQTARAWLNAPAAADEQATASVFLQSMVPGLIFVRGSNLASANPTYYALYLQRGMFAQLLKVVNGQTTVLGTITSQDYISNQWITGTLSVTGNQLRVQIYRPRTGQYLGQGGVWQSAPTWVLPRTDASITTPGRAGVGRYAGYTGQVAFDNFTESYASTSGTGTGGTGSTSGPVIPQHYDWIRIAELAYSSLPIGAFEDELLRNSVDLVVSDPTNLSDHIHAVAPDTPQLAYLNTSSIYSNLLTDWLNYADAHGISREAAFYHVAQATPFSGSSGSSIPVTWFWGVYQGGASPDFIDLTSASHTPSGQAITFGGNGTSLYIGYPDRFREINFRLAEGARYGWRGVLEYPTAVDAQGNPTAWAPLKTLADTTHGLSWSGKILFDPPANWKTSVAGGTARLYYLRIRTISDGTPPVALTILGADYVHAYGTNHGVIPAFDYAADTNHDGYLSDAEYAHRRPGMDARFAYQSRVFYGIYGQMRFASNPSNPYLRNWAVDYSKRFLDANPNAGGLFLDNSGGNPTFIYGNIRESTSTYATDFGAMLAAINKAIAPRWVMANTSGGNTTTADGVIQQVPGYFEEFALRPLAASWAQFENVAAIVAHRNGLRSTPPYAVLDALPLPGSPTDPRTEIATLAYYYLLANPKTTFLDPFGGYEPGTNWNRHWIPAITFDVGQPTGEWSLFANGSDPGNHALTYRIYQRKFTNALVLYKPLSYAQGASASGSLGSWTATTHYLGGTYRPLRADGTLGSPVTRITLHNGEGAILIKV
jgi:hypothetical protein